MKLFTGILVIALLLSAVPVLAQDSDQVTVTFTLNNLAINALRDSEATDEVYIRYTIQEVIGDAPVEDNLAVSDWGLAEVNAGDQFSAAEFDSLALRIGPGSSVRVEIHVLESDADQDRWAQMWHSSCSADLAGPACIARLLFGGINVEFEGTYPAPIYDQTAIQSGVQESRMFIWTGPMHAAAYALTYSLGTGTAAPLAVNVLSSDEFDGDALSTDDWWLYSLPPTLGGGALRMDGQENWNLGMIAAQPLGANEGVLLSFKYQPGQMGMFLFRNEWESPDYQRWLLDNAEATWTNRTLQGLHGENTVDYEAVDLVPDTWYYLLFRIDGNGGFDTWIWPQADPVGYALHAHAAPYGGSWIGGEWRFGTDVYAGSLEIGFFRRIAFPADFVMPAIPPLIG